VPVQRDVGGVEIEDDLPRGRTVRLEEQVHEQRPDRGGVVADPMTAAGLARGCVLEAVQRALAGQRRAARTARLQLAGEHGQRRVVPKAVVVDHVLVAEGDAEDTLADQGGDLVLHALRRPRIAEAGREAPHQPDGTIGGPEQQRAGIGGDRPAVEAGDHGAAFDGYKLEQRRATLRRHRGPPLRRREPLSQKNFRRFRAPMHLRLVRYAG
jgi:hypothetical protein